MGCSGSKSITTTEGNQAESQSKAKRQESQTKPQESQTKPQQNALETIPQGDEPETIPQGNDPETKPPGNDSETKPQENDPDIKPLENDPETQPQESQSETKSQESQSESKTQEAVNKDDENKERTEEEPSVCVAQYDDYLTITEAVDHVTQELGVSEEKAAKIIHSLEKNPEGKLSKQELCNLRTILNENKKKFQGVFEEHDKDGTGKVSIEEAFVALKYLLPEVSEDGLTRMVARYEEEGQMNYNPLVHFYAIISSKKERLKERCNEMDENNTDELDSSQLLSVIVDECACDEKEAQSLIDDFDLGNDGEISKTQFIELLEKSFS